MEQCKVCKRRVYPITPSHDVVVLFPEYCPWCALRGVPTTGCYLEPYQMSSIEKTFAAVNEVFIPAHRNIANGWLPVMQYEDLKLLKEWKVAW